MENKINPKENKINSTELTKLIVFFAILMVLLAGALFGLSYLNSTL